MVLNNDSKYLRLQKQVAYRYKNRPVYKYRLNIPSQMIEKLGWQNPDTKIEIRLINNTKIELVRTEPKFHIEHKKSTGH